MNKIYLIFRHEFLHTVKRVSYILITLAIPVLCLLAIGIFALLKSLSEPAEEKSRMTIGFVDETGIFDDPRIQGPIKLVPYASKEDASRAVSRKEISEYFLIPADYLSKGTIRRYTTDRDLLTPAATTNAIRHFLTANLLEDKVSPAVTDLVLSPPGLEIIRLNENGDIAPEQGNRGNSAGNIIIPGVFSLLLAFALMFGAVSLITGLGEEKESRLIEVLFSSVSVRQLLIAKVLALGTAGLLQVLVWLISAPLLLHLASSLFGGFLTGIQVPANFIILGIIYFILGYLLFAVFSIGCGAISSSAREGGELSMFYTLTSFIPLWFSSLLIAFPGSTIWIVFTIFPVTAPIQTMLRLGVSDIPLWQILASIGLLVTSVLAGMILSVRIFRRHMLLHGKRPGLGEIIRSLRGT
jgi:ABC-2 type transport system permease protein